MENMNVQEREHWSKHAALAGTDIDEVNSFLSYKSQGNSITSVQYETYGEGQSRNWGV